MIRARALAACFILLGAGTAFAQKDAAKGAGDKGQSIASQVCAACHAADGNSPVPANPKIAGQFADYLNKQLNDFKAVGGKKPARESAVMNGMVANLSPADMKALAAYYSGQKPRLSAASDKDVVAQGQKLWRGGNAATGVPACAGCHGPTGAGIPGQYPRLAGQYPEYIAAQLKLFREGGRANDPNGVMRGVASKMSEREMNAVAQYAAGLR